MQVRGRTIVLTACGVSLALSAYAWWHHYQESRRAAEYWGAQTAKLIIGQSTVTLVTLAAASPAIDLTKKRGLVHLRYALTSDASFDWEGRYDQVWEPGDWDYAIEFSDGAEARRLFFRDTFREISRGTRAGESCEVLPCPRLGAAIRRYFAEVDVKLSAATRPR